MSSWNRNLLIGLGAVAAVAALLALSALYTVHQTQNALVLQFGEPRRLVQEPGLHVKIPFIQNVVYFDKRVLEHDSAAEEYILGDQKRLVVDSFARFRITDPLRFYQAVRDEARLRDRLDDVLNASMRKVLGETPLFTVLSADRIALMEQIRDSANHDGRQFGIDVIDVRLKRSDLPAENSQAIYHRMQTEREREAMELRAQGAEMAQRIRSRADRERRVILAEAHRESETVRGEGDGQAVAIFADAFGRDEDFFGFYRSMQAYRNAFHDENTSFVMSPEGEFFRFFNGTLPQVQQVQEPRPMAPAVEDAAPAAPGYQDVRLPAPATDGMPAGGVMPDPARAAGLLAPTPME